MTTHSCEILSKSFKLFTFNYLPSIISFPTCSLFCFNIKKKCTFHTLLITIVNAIPSSLQHVHVLVHIVYCFKLLISDMSLFLGRYLICLIQSTMGYLVSKSLPVPSPFSIQMPLLMKRLSVCTSILWFTSPYFFSIYQN
jgi:hypothetical protein